MIIRKSQVPAIADDGRGPDYGPFESLRYSEGGEEGVTWRLVATDGTVIKPGARG